MRYPSERLHEEVAYLAHHLHWSHDELMSMEHLDRRRWVDEVVKMQQRAGDDSASPWEG
jgi:Family of unknown function (DUF6760)